MKEALLYQPLDGGRVRCQLCSHYCVIADGRKGICRVRQNRGGSLWTLADGRVISHHVDPIEKKPLYHFYPGSRAFSIGVPGCNLSCDWCQNWQISQLGSQYDSVPDQIISPTDIINSATTAACRSIAYTYTEPTIFFEYGYEIAQLAHQADMFNIYVSNGYMSGEMVELISPWLDGINIDLKAFRDETYRRYTGAHLQPVLDNLRRFSSHHIWLEVTTLVIPGINDDSEELRDIAQFIADELGCDTPWHVSRFYPYYKMTDVPPTPPETLYRAVEIGRAAGLKYVYVGNLDGVAETICPGCQRVVVVRDRFGLKNRLDGSGCCPDCGEKIAGVGMGDN